MPTYEYRCGACQHEFEQSRSMHLDSIFGDDLLCCPQCGSSLTLRKLSVPAIHFKGPGFYSTDKKDGNNDKTGEV